MNATVIILKCCLRIIERNNFYLSKVFLGNKIAQRSRSKIVTSKNSSRNQNFMSQIFFFSKSVSGKIICADCSKAQYDSSSSFILIFSFVTSSSKICFGIIFMFNAVLFCSLFSMH